MKPFFLPRSFDRSTFYSLAIAGLILLAVKQLLPGLCGLDVSQSSAPNKLMSGAQTLQIRCKGSVVLLTRHSKHPFYGAVVGLGEPRDLLSRVFVTTQAVRVDPELDANHVKKGAPSGLSLVRDGMVYEIPSPELRALFYRLGILDTVVLPPRLAFLPFMAWGGTNFFQLVVSHGDSDPIPSRTKEGRRFFSMDLAEFSRYVKLNYGEYGRYLQCR